MRLWKNAWIWAIVVCACVCQAEERAAFNRVRFFPAPGREQAMLGGKFAGSNVSARSGYEVLAEIKTVPRPGQWSELSFPNTKHFRWLRYEAPAGSHGCVAEVEFYAGERKLDFGRFGSLGHQPNDYRTAWQSALDGKTNTWFDSDVADGQYVGVDAGYWSVPAPAMDPPLGRQEGPVLVTLRCGSPQTVIRYSLEGTPGPDEGQVYSGPIRIDHSATLFAAAYRKDAAPSPTACGTYLVGEPAGPGLSTFHIGNSILPCTIAAGWLKNLIDHGKIPGLSPADFPPIMFHDNYHPSPIGSYLVDMTWYAAFYGESPVGKVLPVDTELRPGQAAALQRLAWDVVKNYPECGLYEEGTTPCGRPEFSPPPRAIHDITAVTLTSSTPDAWFRYTLDGTEPTRTRGYVYCGVVSVRPGMTLRAVAYKSGQADSPAAAAVYAKAQTAPATKPNVTAS